VDELFSSLGRAVEGSPGVAVAAAFAWGVLSIVLSPCHLASIPLIVGFVSGQAGRITTRRACGLSTMFSVGILVTIAAIGALTAAAGRMMGDLGAAGNFVVAAIFLAVGLHLLGVLPAPWSGPGQARVARRGAIAAFVLGLVFGVALGPCTFAYMAPMLAVTFKLAAARMGYGILLLVAYGLGHCSVLVLAGTCTELVQRYLRWTDASRAAAILRGVCGVLVIMGGLYLLWAAPMAS
jgi:cytochrome c-type biogenesis protein